MIGTTAVPVDDPDQIAPTAAEVAKTLDVTRAQVYLAKLRVSAQVKKSFGIWKRK